MVGIAAKVQFPLSAPEINIPLTEPQQSLVINLVGQKDAILHGIDDTSRLNLQTVSNSLGGNLLIGETGEN